MKFANTGQQLRPASGGKRQRTQHPKKEIRGKLLWKFSERKPKVDSKANNLKSIFKCLYTF